MRGRAGRAGAVVHGERELGRYVFTGTADAATESTLERHRAERGVTKSLVVQESLAAYLLTGASRPVKAAATGRAGGNSQLSANYRAFAEAGLIGGMALGLGADKAAVRARVAESFVQRKARRGGV